MYLNNGLVWCSKVVSTISFSFNFVCFRTVEYVQSAKALYLWCHSLDKKVPMEKESSHSVGSTSTFIALFPHIYKRTNNERKSGGGTHCLDQWEQAPLYKNEQNERKMTQWRLLQILDFSLVCYLDPRLFISNFMWFYYHYQGFFVPYKMV